MTLILNKDSAVLQGAFLQADKLCHPSSLSCIHKSDWSRVESPILQALREISGQDEGGGYSNLKAPTWKKKIVCAVWLKLLCSEAEEDVEASWRENPFFSLQNSLPDVNHVVLLELVKSAAAVHYFTSFLLHLPRPWMCTELERLVEHVRSNPTREDDVCFFLEVWWELWKGQDGFNTKEDNSIELMFADQFARLSSKSSSMSPQAAKRLKLDSPDLTNTDVLYILFNALKDISGHLTSPELCFKALCISLDALHTSFLIDQEVVLPAKEKLNILCKVISARGKNEKLSPTVIQEAQRDLHASLSPSQFRASRIKLTEALQIITELVKFCEDGGLLKVNDGLNPASFQLEQSVQRVLTRLNEAESPEAVAAKEALRGLLTSLSLPDMESSPETGLQVTSTIISHRLEEHEDFAALFASETSWALCDERWMSCLEKNPAAFQQHNTLISLSSTLMSKLQRESSDISRCRKLMKIIADVFSGLSLEDKNKSLAAMLRLSSSGFFSHSTPSAVADGFEQELNMAFNCMIQGGGGASASQGNLTTAVSLVARVAFQNPEATLRSCCHSAVFNRGAFSLMAKILQQLPGLRSQRGGKGGDEGGDTGSGSSLLCRCLQGIIGNKSLSAGERQQLLKFLGLLMAPDVVNEEEKKIQSFLTPQEVVNTFVLPNLSAAGRSTIDGELSLQLLHAALSVDVQEAAPSPHWVLDCSPFPLLYVLAQLHHQTLRCWEQPPEGTYLCSMDTKELLVSVLTKLGQVVGAEVALAPSSWSRPLFWLYNKMEGLDWTVRFHLKPVWGQHFKNEVPASLLAVCELPEQEWSGLDLPQYGQGTGLLAWMECCSISDSLQSIMLSHLSLDQNKTDHMSMFSKGLLVALTQTLPWCSVSQWTRLLKVLKELITSNRLNVPFSLEYVDYLPLLDLRQFSYELRLSVLLLRVFQLLCGSSCSDWLSASGWAHVSRLYAHAVREMINSVKAKLACPSPAALTTSAPKAPPSRCLNPSPISVRAPKMYEDPLKESQMEEEVDTAPSQEVLFVLSQFFCHVQHIQVMMPGGQCEPLFLCSLEILSHYEAIMAAFPDSCSSLESDNTRHFFSTITDNLENQEMKAVLQQKIAQLVSTAA
ncbi:gem-associated protein 4 [Melanotaenia boesemani]|uniref:gem-associated protein 4 n=1 Tax=Melanotaenia boesemani TaxID=1250792 RepID=UPI001C04FC1D|nr:gem-associated protein 4 [Melanotaenia boesemani]